MRRWRFIGWLGVATVLGAALLFASWTERARVLSDMQRHFESHVRSVADLIDEATLEAASATALIYDKNEAELHLAARLLEARRDLACRDDAKPDPEFPVMFCEDEHDAVRGAFGTLTPDARETLLRLGRETPDTLLDDEPLRDSGLVCLAHEADGSRYFVCQSSAALEELRRTTGLGALLKRVIRNDVRYVGVQDAHAVLAAVPSAEFLTAWNDDPALAEVLAAPNKQLTLRRLSRAPALYEGLVPLHLADGSTALLRIGIDARSLVSLEQATRHRFLLMVTLVTAVLILIGVLLIWRARVSAREEAAARRLAAQEKERQHWEMIGQMAATVAHEVRNPLNTLGLIVQRLEREFSIPDDERADFADMLGIMKSESLRVNRVVTDFLDLGRPLSLTLEDFPAMLAIEESLGALRVRAEREGKRFVLESGEGWIGVDRKRFAQVLQNLVGNALDAVVEGGEVRVASGLEHGELVVAVTDDGPGMTEEDLREVLKPFVSRKASGTGLGLPLVKRYTEAMRGRLILVSVVGQGTRAELRFPCVEGKRIIR